MRKYFLLSAAALLAATSANASSYATVYAKAKVELVNKLECSDLNFGTIYIEPGKGGTVYVDDGDFAHFTGGVVRVDGAEAAECNIDWDAIESSTHENKTILISEEYVELHATGVGGESYIHLYDINYDGDAIYGKIDLPAEIEAGEYSGSFSLTYVY